MTLYALYPVYHSTEKLNFLGLNIKGISKLIQELLLVSRTDLKQNLSPHLIKKYNFLDRQIAFNTIHFPQNTDQLNKSIYRFKFEELFFLQIAMLKQKIIRKKRIKSFIFKKVGNKFNNFFHNHINFDLTNAQKRVMKEIRLDMLSGFQMKRLLQCAKKK